MKFRVGLVLGLAVGYYFGAKAGRQRYDELNVLLNRIRRTDTVQSVMGQARGASDRGMHRARDMLGQDTVDRAREWIDPNDLTLADFDDPRRF